MYSIKTFVGILIFVLVSEARIIKRESIDSTLSDANVVRTYVLSSESQPSTYTIISSGNKERFVRQSSSYSAPASSNNVFLSSSSSSSSSSSQPVYTSYISSPATSISTPSVASSPTATTYISSPSVSTPSLTISVPSTSSSSSETSSAAATAANPLAGLTALLLPKSGGTSGTSGSSDILGGVGGFIQTASGGVKTVLEIKRDVILPLIIGLFDFIKNVASSDTLRTIANVQLNAARSALTVGPSLIQSLADLAKTAGEVTSSFIKTILCNIICPLQEDKSTCRTQSSCDVGTTSSSSNTLKTSYTSSAPSTSYIVR
eukprot:TRINITY_DN1381_c0_g1_i1.p1 TRINITY_DN1381_c0_g1~~TRINITY_DN1381_c0_g1_i1.p1  ORF type:complete len:318 (+),score=57.90 TRINITY_DN1381_c0_g1_i1:66-1019(+)